MSIYEVIDARRQERKMSASALAREAWMEPRQMYLVRAGKRGLRADEFLLLCRILGLDIKDFEEVVL